MLKIITFVQSALQELRYKVSWPTQEDLQRMIMLFIIGILICTALVGGINIFLKRMMDWIYRKF